ncbi:hypothetical protein [Streptomyces hygroscopicus]|uniref:hypothetical protein n=1 Tax=Streptomyces hygroscopicus TaxID=1912 RepID=UPI003677207B
MHHELDVILTQGARTADGRWWADCEAILPTRYEHADGRSHATGAPTAISALSERITPFPARTCGTVPVDGAITGRQRVVEQFHQHTEDPPSAVLTAATAGRPATSSPTHRASNAESAVESMRRRQPNSPTASIPGASRNG